MEKKLQNLFMNPALNTKTSFNLAAFLVTLMVFYETDLDFPFVEIMYINVALSISLPIYTVVNRVFIFIFQTKKRHSNIVDWVK
jgi:hypothetical protein